MIRYGYLLHIEYLGWIAKQVECPFRPAVSSDPDVVSDH